MIWGTKNSSSMENPFFGTFIFQVAGFHFCTFLNSFGGKIC